MNARRQIFFEILINGVLPYLLYSWLKDARGYEEVPALLWATIVPALVVIVGLLRQRKLDPVALITLVTLGLGIAVAAVTEDARLLQLRESYLSAVIGGVMLLSALVGRPALVWLVPRVMPPERRHQVEHPLLKKLLTRLTWIWGLLFSAELAVKWWMVETLTIAQVLAAGPVVFAVLTAAGMGFSYLAARSLRLQAQPPVASPDRQEDPGGE